MIKLIAAISLLLLSVDINARIYTFEDKCKEEGGKVFIMESISSIGYTPDEDGVIGMLTTIPKDNSIIEKRLFFIPNEGLYTIARDAYYNSDYIDICAYTNRDYFLVALFINLPQQ
ncbi:hypothetical protein ACQPT2_20995 [Erwinia amylovora]